MSVFSLARLLLSLHVMKMKTKTSLSWATGLGALMVLLALADSTANNRGTRAYSDLTRFAQRTSDLSRATAFESIGARETTGVVAQMLDDARLYDRTMRENQGFSRVDWSGPLRILEQMAVALPRS